MSSKLSLVAVLVLLVVSCKKNEEVWSFSSAKTEMIITGPGPEDILLDEVGKRILVSCDQRREEGEAFAEIMAIDLSTDAVMKLERTGEPDEMPFHPHGFYLQKVNSKDYLYVINHFRDESNKTTIIQYELSGHQLKFIKAYESELMISPNEVCALPNGGFYFTNDKGGPDLITEQLFNKYGGSLVYCNSSGECKYVDRDLAFPNGLEYRNGQLFLATTRHQALFRYTVSENGDLSNRTKINKINGLDNLRWSGDMLTVAVHPDELAFVAHSLSVKAKSPSVVYQIDPETGEAEKIFEDNGKRISGSSTAIEINGKLYISQVFENFVLKVDLP